MTRVSRQAWADLRFAHPAVDPADPTDDFAQALIAATGGDPDVWVTGGEAEALTAYQVALRSAIPDHTWASDALERDSLLALEMEVCAAYRIPHSVFLGWDERDQDLAVAHQARKADVCPAGRHPRAAMTDPDAVEMRRVHCAACAREADIDERFHDAPRDARVGWYTEVSRVPR